MAIQISGTEVISNSRGLNNIASVDATTAASISAAGVGGGGTQDFVASGTVSTGDVVVLKSDGTVAVVGNVFTPDSAPTNGTQAGFGGTYMPNQPTIVYDSSNNKVVLIYANWTIDYPTAVVGTVSGSTISFGTPVTIESSDGYDFAATFDSNANKVVVTWSKSSNLDGRAAVGTISGTSISFGTVATWDTGQVGTNQHTTCFDSNSNKVVIAYKDYATSTYPFAVVGTVSGTSISFGTRVTIRSASVQEHVASTFDSNNNKVLVTYRVFGQGLCKVGTVSGTSISFGTEATFNSTGNGRGFPIYDSGNGKIVVIYRNEQSNVNYLAGVVGTISGTSISFGSGVNIWASAIDNQGTQATYDSNSGQIICTFINDPTGNHEAVIIAGTVSGTSLSFPTIASGDWLKPNGTTFSEYTSCVLDANANKIVMLYRDDSAGGKQQANPIKVSSATSNYGDWIGISTEAISSGSTGTITVIGGVNDQQSGLTVGSTYYVDSNGSLTTTSTSNYKVGKAIAATDLLITEGNT